MKTPQNEIESIGDIIKRIKEIRKPTNTNPTTPEAIDFSTVQNVYFDKYKLEVEKRAKNFEKLPQNSDKIVSYIIDMLTYKAYESKNKPWLWLTGYVGNGKTTSARALQQTFAQVSNKNAFKMYEAVEIAQIYEQKDHFNFNTLLKCNFLIIDDMGVEVNLNKKQHAIAEVLYYRYKMMLPTVITTNLTRDQIKQIYDERIFDRMEELSTKIVFAEKSYRR